MLLRSQTYQLATSDPARRLRENEHGDRAKDYCSTYEAVKLLGPPSGQILVRERTSAIPLKCFKA